MPKERGLGRGLESLIPAHVRENPKSSPTPSEALSVDVNKIKPGRYQPRTKFDEENLAELASSIKSQGVIQPIVVSTQNGGYELIAGERRLRAAKMAGISRVPIVIKNVSDKEQFVIALIENLQRENLNAIEEAKAYKRLMDEFNLTQEQLASTIGKGRVVIANTLRLLTLPQNIQDSVSDGTISAGHARNLASIGDDQFQRETAEKVLKENLTVRDVEKLVSNWKQALETGRVSSPSRKDPQVRELESSLEKVLGTKIEITSRGKDANIQGQVKISYFSLGDLDRLVEIFNRK